MPRGARQGRHRDRLERVPVHAGRLRGWRVHKHGRLVPMRVPEWLHVGREWEAVRGQQRMPVPAEHMRERDVHEHRRGFRVLVQRGIHPGSEPGLRGRERVPRARQPMRLPLPQRPWLVQMHLPLRLHSGSGRETLHRSPISYPLIFFIISLENFQLYSITYMIHERCLSLFSRRGRVRDTCEQLQVSVQESYRLLHVHLPTWIPADRYDRRVQRRRRMRD